MFPPFSGNSCTAFERARWLSQGDGIQTMANDIHITLLVVGVGFGFRLRVFDFVFGSWELALGLRFSIHMLFPRLTLGFDFDVCFWRLVLVVGFNF